MKPLKILGNERGGVSIMIFSILALLFSVIVMVYCLDYILLYSTQNKLKNDLNAAVHAGSLSIDEVELAEGNFKLDTITPGISAQDMFYKYLRLNMGLDLNNIAVAGSKLKPGTPVHVDELVYIDYEAGTLFNLGKNPTTCSYSLIASRITCAVTLNNGSSTKITRTIDETIVGPSIVAVVDTIHESIGSLSNEPLLLPAVQEVYFTK
ncbi:hypothetical protein I8J29_16550 [Paenibacillus sp. MWE-103]|uniref:Flp pilus-assembly TadG-like N-terminal domain-containing protein n=1 Tax=Paenibacillus artemisiicola TaxID=1172618 RepID=A0ABS3WBW4_9BACL|nr:hypothetical protein [Paenibacillus artemisiicola]MBO7745820.1 hypothetical protein [Paenibacillus artemisiicola]